MMVDSQRANPTGSPRCRPGDGCREEGTAIRRGVASPSSRGFCSALSPSRRPTVLPGRWILGTRSRRVACQAIHASHPPHGCCGRVEGSHHLIHRDPFAAFGDRASAPAKLWVGGSTQRTRRPQPQNGAAVPGARPSRRPCRQARTAVHGPGRHPRARGSRPRAAKRRTTP